MNRTTASALQPERTDPPRLLAGADPGETGATILDEAFRRPANDGRPLTPEALAAKALATMREPAMWGTLSHLCPSDIRFISDSCSASVRRRT